LAERQFIAEAYQREWRVVEKKERKRGKVFDMHIEKGQEIENEVEKEKETEAVIAEDKSSSDVSESTAEIPRELREMAREGRESEERLWFDLDEDFRGPCRG
jgi:CRISPR/Cas system CMR subunit Cmr4 (Cas7 group RAMP superfamily)